MYTYGSNNLESRVFYCHFCCSQEYQDEIRELFQSENDSWKKLFLRKHTYDRFLNQVKQFFMPVWKKFDAPVLEEVTNYFYEIQSTSSNQLYGFIIPIMYHGTSIQGTPSGLNRDVSSIAVTDTKIMWMFFWEQSLCPLNEGVS